MKTLLFSLLLALFVAPLALDESPAWHSPPSPSAPVAPAPVDNAAPAASPQVARERERTDAPVAAAVAAATAPHETPSAEEPPAPVAQTELAEPDLASAIEEEILRLTNAERAAAGTGTLTRSAKLREIAWAHSADMLARGFFDHNNPDGCSSSCRATNAGYAWRAIGENLYMMSGFEITPTKTARMVVEGWMDSPGHRANLLKDTFTESGVGVVIVGKSVYVTALYGKQR